MTDELIAIYDENNDFVGKEMKSEAHKEGLWHRAVHVWIYNSKGEVILQLRNKDKDVFPDMWDVSVAGHVGFDEGLKETAVRETKEELGINVNEKDLEFYRIMKDSIQSNGLTNKEFIYIFFYQYNRRDLNIQKDELQEAGFFSIEEIKEDMGKNPNKYTFGGKGYWEEMIKEIQKRTGK